MSADSGWTTARVRLTALAEEYARFLAGQDPAAAEATGLPGLALLPRTGPEALAERARFERELRLRVLASPIQGVRWRVARVLIDLGVHAWLPVPGEVAALPGASGVTSGTAPRRWRCCGRTRCWARASCASRWTSSRAGRRRRCPTCWGRGPGWTAASGHDGGRRSGGGARPVGLPQPRHLPGQRGSGPARPRARLTPSRCAAECGGAARARRASCTVGTEAMHMRLGGCRPGTSPEHELRRSHGPWVLR